MSVVHCELNGPSWALRLPMAVLTFSILRDSPATFWLS